MPALRLILGDQLSHTISSLQDIEPAADTILMCEVLAEATYVRHHQKKIAFLFAAMRHLGAELRELGWTVRYVQLDDPTNTGSFEGEVARALADGIFDRIIVTEPANTGCWRSSGVGPSVSVCPCISGRIVASLPASPSSGSGGKARASPEWNFSTARCGANTRC